MLLQRETVMTQHGLSCPVCGAKTNRDGNAFVSEWALASHVAGSIHGGERLHRSWAKHHAPEVDLRQSVPRLAEGLMWLIRQALKADHLRERPAAPTPISLLHEMERKLHDHVRCRLEAHFGCEQERWWTRGIPLPIRLDCAKRREEDSERKDPYAYTYLIDLKAIVDKNWPLFEQDHTRLRASLPTKRHLLDLLTRLNDVRNRHSHPIRAPEPTSNGFASDLSFLSEAAQLLSNFCSR